MFLRTLSAITVLELISRVGAGRYIPNSSNPPGCVEEPAEPLQKSIFAEILKLLEIEDSKILDLVARVKKARDDNVSEGRAISEWDTMAESLDSMHKATILGIKGAVVKKYTSIRDSEKAAGVSRSCSTDSAGSGQNFGSPIDVLFQTLVMTEDICDITLILLGGESIIDVALQVLQGKDVAISNLTTAVEELANITMSWNAIIHECRKIIAILNRTHAVTIQTVERAIKHKSSPSTNEIGGDLNSSPGGSDGIPVEAQA